MGEYCFEECGLPTALIGLYKVGCDELDEVDRSVDRNDEVDGKLDESKSVLRPEKVASD